MFFIVLALIYNRECVMCQDLHALGVVIYVSNFPSRFFQFFRIQEEIKTNLKQNYIEYQTWNL